MSDRLLFLLWSVISFQAGWWSCYFWVKRVKSRVVGCPGLGRDGK